MKQVSIGKGVIVTVAVLIVALIGAIACIVRALDDDGPIASTVREVPSPDGKWVATLETVDNGMGFGQGMLYMRKCTSTARMNPSRTMATRKRRRCSTST